MPRTGCDQPKWRDQYVLYIPRYGTASTVIDWGKKRRGFMLKSVITHRRTTHEALKVPPNAPDGLVVSYTPRIIFVGPTARRESQSTAPARGSEVPRPTRMQGTAVLRVNYKTPSLAVTEPRGTKEITHRRTTHEALKVPPNAPTRRFSCVKNTPRIVFVGPTPGR